MNLPKLPKLSRGRSDGAGDKPPSKVSKFFTDLYRDLADRRLLLPVAGLLVAIVAVPILLKSPTEAPVPPPPLAGSVADPTALDAAVVVSNPGIRDYRQRLAALKARNPFESETAAAPPNTGGGGSGGSGDGAASATSSTSDTSSSSTASTSTPPATPTGGSAPSTSSSTSTSTDTTTDTTTDTSTESSGGTSTDTNTDTTTDETTDTTTDHFLAGRVDVTVGLVGKAKTLEGVHALDFLPSADTPIASFLGLTGSDRALFSVNPAVAESSGEGTCAPKHADGCQYLELKVGQERRFVYGDGDDARVYRLKLLATHVVKVPDPREQRAGHADDDSQ
jgi:hypothetical protein